MAIATHPMLREGDGISSPNLREAVKLLQRKLGLPESQIDGMFGQNTETAVKRIQRDNGLLVDGIAGENTWSALLDEPVELVVLNSPVVGKFDVDKIVGTISFPHIRANARKSVPIILQECKASGVTIRGQIAYILATAQHESHLGGLMVELASGIQYEGRRDLGNTERGDGQRFKGRGFVQITGRRNYTHWKNKLGLDLVSHPEKTADPTVAAKILVEGMRDGSFTNFRLGNFISARNRDFVNARKIINGTDRARVIAAIAEDFFHIL